MAEPQTATERVLAQVLLSSLDFGLLALDQDNRIVFINRKACEVFTSDSEHSWASRQARC